MATNAASSEAQLAYFLVFILLVGMAVILNTLVLLVVINLRSMRTFLNIMIANISLADIVYVIFTVLFSVSDDLTGSWLFGLDYCRLYYFFSYVTIMEKGIVLIVLSVDRYARLVRPSRKPWSERIAVRLCAISWLFSSLVSLPAIIIANVDYNEFTLACYLYIPSRLSQNIFNIVTSIVVFAYIVAGIVFILAFLVVIRSMRKHEQTDPAAVTRLKDAQMTLVLLLVFTVCWTPLWIQHTMLVNSSSITFSLHAYLLLYILASSTSITFPGIYLYLNTSFRNGLKFFFKWCPFIACTPSDSMDNLDNHVASSTVHVPLVETVPSPNDNCDLNPQDALVV